MNLVYFDAFELDLRTGELWRNRRPVDLRPLAARALIALVANAGRVVSRDELRGILWPDVVVAWDQSLNQCIRQVRRALGDDAAAPRFVETVPRRGYRFSVPVERRPAAAARRPASSRGAGSRTLVAFLAGTATALAIPIIVLVICAVLA